MTTETARTMKQADLGLILTPKRTRKRVFLDEMNRVVPWARSRFDRFHGVARIDASRQAKLRGPFTTGMETHTSRDPR